MSRLSATIARLAAMRASHSLQALSAGPSRLVDLDAFGTNPGALNAKIYVPEKIAEKPALVVILHGCTQTAEGYDRGAGWSQLANEHGFLLLFPEQRRANNPNLCFNWFSPTDNGRDLGEALSIRQMIMAMVNSHGVDPSRIFVTGLSAGGAMTSVMLASYPELFAGGAIIAGLPYGLASNISQALETMRGCGAFDAEDLGDRVRRASAHSGPWPRISIWHGSADATVSSSNAEAILAQWLSVHGLEPAPDVSEQIAGHRRRSWNDAVGRPLIEDYRIAKMGHGTHMRHGNAAYARSGYLIHSQDRIVLEPVNSWHGAHCRAIGRQSSGGHTESAGIKGKSIGSVALRTFMPDHVREGRRRKSHPRCAPGCGPHALSRFHLMGCIRPIR
jgi:poly(hydroxyalkanoate) depolymerase family esterase